MAYQSINPAIGELSQSFTELTSDELDRKLAAAEACYKTWKRTSYGRTRRRPA